MHPRHRLFAVPVAPHLERDDVAVISVFRIRKLEIESAPFADHADVPNRRLRPAATASRHKELSPARIGNERDPFARRFGLPADARTAYRSGGRPAQERTFQIKSRQAPSWELIVTSTAGCARPAND